LSSGRTAIRQSKATKEGVIFGAHLRKLRLARGLTQGDVAAQCATSVAFISNVERGLMLPGLAVLLRLADALECNVSELVRVLDPTRADATQPRRK
jgi:transcriptional regulator with XRE-family HTH domain